ncbi:hypothetical protein R1flu_026815 [Riccia fluitans]|uniref:Uncharacterized protein n=1 Tax=Riccia fluitans TaxID=41844 RepID=A0ABD1XGZ3_9MARC
MSDLLYVSTCVNERGFSAKSKAQDDAHVEQDIFIRTDFVITRGPSLSRTLFSTQTMRYSKFIASKLLPVIVACDVPVARINSR